MARIFLLRSTWFLGVLFYFTFFLLNLCVLWSCFCVCLALAIEHSSIYSKYFPISLFLIFCRVPTDLLVLCFFFSFFFLPLGMVYKIHRIDVYHNSSIYLIRVCFFIYLSLSLSLSPFCIYVLVRYSEYLHIVCGGFFLFYILQKILFISKF